MEHEDTNYLDEEVGSLLGNTGGVLGNYIVVAEVVYPTGVELRVQVSPGIAPWTAMGMMHQALEEVGVAAYHATHPTVISGEEYEEFYDDDDDLD